jgi:hypothetical protein
MSSFVEEVDDLLIMGFSSQENTPLATSTTDY